MLKGVLTGNLVRDPHMATTKTGVVVCNMDVATESKQQDESGKAKTIFVKVTAWRGLAEICGKHLTKGRKVGIYGRIDEAHAYMGSDGAPHGQICMTADDVEFLSGRGDIVADEPQNTGMNQYRQEPRAEQDGFIAVNMDDELPF